MNRSTRIRLVRPIALGLACSAALVVALASRARAKPANDLQVLTGFSSKESCSCAFVVDQSDAYCQQFGKLEGYDVTVVIDRGAKKVTSSFLGIARSSVFVEGQGCLLDPLP